jgi:RNA-binding protein
MMQLSPAERRQLRARAHALAPVVSIAQNGLTETVLKEIDRSLSAHELIKIRVYSDDRSEREAYLNELCTQLAAQPVQHIGKLLVVFRANPVDASASTPRRRAEPRRTKRSYQGQD